MRELRCTASKIKPFSHRRRACLRFYSCPYFLHITTSKGFTTKNQTGTSMKWECIEGTIGKTKTINSFKGFWLMTHQLKECLYGTPFLYKNCTSIYVIIQLFTTFRILKINVIHKIKCIKMHWRYNCVAILKRWLNLSCFQNLQ